MLRELLNIKKDSAVKLDRILKSSIVLALVVFLCVLLLVPSVVFAQDNLTKESINPGSLDVADDDVDDDVVDATQVAAFVTRFYQECLSRDPDAGGLNTWVDWLESGAKTGADVAYGFVFSDEFIQRGVSNSEYLTILYRAFFAREPDSGGYNTWLGYLNTGKSRQWVLAGFINSDEFKNLCSAYGINPGSLEVEDDDTDAEESIEPIEGEFVIIEESFFIDPWTTHKSYYRTVETEDKELMLLEAPGKMIDGKDVIIRRNWSGVGLISITAFVMDLEFTLKVSGGTLIGEWREETYLPEAKKTVHICHSGEKVRMTGYVEKYSWSGFQGVKVFTVSTIEKID